LRFWDMACSLSLEPLARFVTGGAGARPDHPISGDGQGILVDLNEQPIGLNYQADG